MPVTANKGYSVPTPGTESGTWGADLNANTFATMDTNMGGVIAVTLSNLNVNLTAPQTQNLCVRLVGAMTGNVVLTAAFIGFMIIENATTGAFTVTLTNGLGATANIPQGQASLFVSDSVNGCRPVGSDIPSGSQTIFRQTNAPVGWTKFMAFNESAIRIVNGTVGFAGGSPFSSVFAPRYISVANMPSHNHGVTDPGHVHSFPASSNIGGASAYGGATTAVTPNTLSATTGISIQNNGSGTAMDFAVAYVDFIVATRN